MVSKSGIPNNNEYLLFQMKVDNYIYAFEEVVDDEIKDLLMTIPGRWGRMPPLSRAVVVEAAKLLKSHNLLHSGINQAEKGKNIGLIGGTRCGSHTTDLAFAETFKDDVALASPAIFGYTLANIPLAEAANHFGLTGPVYAVVDPADPFKKALEQANRILETQNNLDLMLACAFDSTYHKGAREQLTVTFTLVDRK